MNLTLMERVAIILTFLLGVCVFITTCARAAQVSIAWDVVSGAVKYQPFVDEQCTGRWVAKRTTYITAMVVNILPGKEGCILIMPVDTAGRLGNGAVIRVRESMINGGYVIEEVK